MPTINVSNDGGNMSAFFSAALGGSTGGYLMFPFEGMKKRVQSGQRVHLHPSELFRGSIPFAMSVTVATVASHTCCRVLQAIPGYDPYSQKDQAISAIVGGMMGAAAGSTPVENVILTQQLHRASPMQACRILFSQGITRPWVGLPELAMREAGFAGVWLWGGKSARAWALEASHSEVVAQVAEIGACVLGAALTHPFDTLATKRQHSNGALSSLGAIRAVYAQWGMKGFFKGLEHRVFLFTGCAIIIPRVQELIRRYI